MKLKLIITGLLLLSYSLVLMHGMVPHQHDEVHQNISGHQHHEDSHQDGDWVHLLGHLLQDIVNADPGQSHFDYFNNSGSSKNFKLYKSADLSLAVDFQVITKQLQPAVGSGPYLNERFNYHIFLISHSKRGPPLAV